MNKFSLKSVLFLTAIFAGAAHADSIFPSGPSIVCNDGKVQIGDSTGWYSVVVSDAKIIEQYKNAVASLPRQGDVRYIQSTNYIAKGADGSEVLNLHFNLHPKIPADGNLKGFTVYVDTGALKVVNPMEASAAFETEIDGKSGIFVRASALQEVGPFNHDSPSYVKFVPLVGAFFDSCAAVVK